MRSRLSAKSWRSRYANSPKDDLINRDIAELASLDMVRYLVQVKEMPSMALTASEARKNLFPLIEKVNDDHQPIEITSKRGDAVLMSRADYDALSETAYLLRAPTNARRLLESLSQAQNGEREVHELA